MAISLIKVLVQKIITDTILDEEKRNTNIIVIVVIIVACICILLIPLYIILTPLENIKIDLGGHDNEYDIIQSIKKDSIVIDKAELIFSGGVLPLPIKRGSYLSLWYESI